MPVFFLEKGGTLLVAGFFAGGGWIGLDWIGV